jgi:hypothetical protein
MQGGYKNDIWGLCGHIEMESIRSWVNSPVSLEEKYLEEYQDVLPIIRTRSGSIYILICPASDKEKTLSEIRKVIERDGYERC